nr:hypothetical protein CFP56_31524 [Quercus suber]
MDGQRRKGLGRALREADVRQARLIGGLENVINAVGDIVESELIHAEIPKLNVRGSMMQRLLAVLVAPVVPEPDVVALVDEREGQTSFLLGQTDPNLTVHEQAVMQIHHAFAHTALSVVVGVDTPVLFAPSVRQTMQAQQVPVLGLDNMLFGMVAEEFAQLDEVLGLRDGAAHVLLAVPRATREERDGAGDTLEEEQKERRGQGEILVNVKPTNEWDGRHDESRSEAAEEGESRSRNGVVHALLRAQDVIDVVTWAIKEDSWKQRKREMSSVERMKL